jgi:YspA, cpYpsA-related SLOG family
VAGSRSITDYELVASAIASSGFSISEVVSGGAKGVDRLGESYARRHEISVRRFKPDWKRYRQGAALRCNADMADYAEALIAVHNGSRGTQDMITRMKSLGKPVHVLRVPDDDERSPSGGERPSE